jgi:cyclophilin family peptidyl-prolyl cis-trans isomerase
VFAIQGAVITLSGSTNQGTPVSLNTVTDANGQYIFFQVQPGTYSLTRTSIGSLVDGQSTVGNLGGSVGPDTITGITVAQGQAGVGYNFGVLGVSTAVISARLWLSSTTAQTYDGFLPAAGAGFSAVDNSVQPAGPAQGGSAALAGLVSGPSGAIGGAQVTLTGTDSTGRDILEITNTAADGTYSFGSLLGGTYELNLTSEATGLRAGQATAGSVGGDIFRNGQVLNIQLAAGASGTGYNFSELPLTSNSAVAGLSLTAGLADDTAGPGGTTSDGLTSDPSVQGVIATSTPLVNLQAGLDGTPASSFVNVLGTVHSDGTFILNPAALAQVNGGPVADGPHTLHLAATNAGGQTTSVAVSFTLVSAPPAVPTLHMDSASDPGQTGATTSSTVTLQGTTSPGDTVQLTQGSTVLTTTADGGSFQFVGVALNPGANLFTVRVLDSAGNVSQLQTFFLLDSGPTAVATAPVNESLVQGSADTFVDLSSPTLFTDPGFSNSLVRFNTTAGPIDVILEDTQAPQTVANFLDYVNQGLYNNDFFHRLVNNFVIQGGNFTFNPASSTITQITSGPTIPDEFTASNPDVAGTISMAMTSQPDSASDQFFFNLVDNSQRLGIPNASNPNGFVVFGKVADAASLRVLNTLAAAPIVPQTSFNSLLDSLPLNNFAGGPFPSSTTAGNYDLITSINVLRQTQQLSFSIVSNSDTTGSVVTASITFGQLDLHPVGAGTATIVVKATDKAGDSATITLAVTVS